MQEMQSKLKCKAAEAKELLLQNPTKANASKLEALMSGIAAWWDDENDDDDDDERSQQHSSRNKRPLQLTLTEEIQMYRLDYFVYITCFKI